MPVEMEEVVGLVEMQVVVVGEVKDGWWTRKHRKNVSEKKKQRGRVGRERMTAMRLAFIKYEFRERNALIRSRARPTQTPKK